MIKIEGIKGTTSHQLFLTYYIKRVITIVPITEVVAQPKSFLLPHASVCFIQFINVKKKD